MNATEILNASRLRSKRRNRSKRIRRKYAEIEEFDTTKSKRSNTTTTNIYEFMEEFDTKKAERTNEWTNELAKKNEREREAILPMKR